MYSLRILYGFGNQVPKLNSSFKIVNTRFSPQLRQMHRRSIYKTQEAKKIKFFVVHKYVEYLKNYDSYFQKSIPVKVYKVFVEGLRLFITDLKEYFQIIQIIYKKGSSLKNLNRKEIELYHQMPKDMKKIAPLLIIAALPIVPYVVFPIVYIFPKLFLTSHFWSIQEQHQFGQELFKKRLLHNKPVFRHLQSQVNFLKMERDPHFIPWTRILGQIGSGVHPTPEQILECMALFRDEPYHLYYLSSNHVKHLAKMHNISSGPWFRRTRLADRATILIAMDKAIMREGGVHNLPIESLKKACLIRGLNPVNMKTDDMISWLNKWISISSQIDKETLSLLLHLPVLIGYNEPSNWVLIYPKK